MKIYLKIFKNYQSSAGFTLIEFLVAMAITSIVISVAGFGLVTIMQRNGKEESENARRVELNRALDFISDDIRMASKVKVASSYTISPASPACGSPTPVPVLHLTIPDSPTNNEIVYYFNDISNCTGNTPATKSLWIKPAFIKRVQNVTTTTIAGSNGSELVDAITNEDVTPNCPTDLSTVSPTPNANGKVKGFYACTNSSNPRAVELHLLGNITDAYGNFIKTYEVKTRVFARSS
ncbi:MAG TPA: type II secretion system protein [Leptolyngbyaceae cyanobacterium]